MRSQNHLRWLLKSEFCRFAFNRLLVIFIFGLGISQIIIYAQTPKKIKVGTIVADPGNKVSGILDVPKGVDQGTIIPVTIINGSKPGPVLTLIAGMHGTEYVPIITLQRILSVIDPNEISGTIIMVQIANLTSFKERKVYYNPIDGKNLNRQFPGNKGGTVTERIAKVITDEVINQSDYLLDLHGGELNENILCYVSFEYDCPDNKVCEKTKFLAHAFGGYYIEPEPYTSVPDSIKFTYCHLTAIRRGVPAIFVEAGGRGNTDNKSILYIEQGISNVMKALNITKGEVIKSNPVIYLYGEIPITSHVDGIFYSMVECGQTVSTGALLGYATDYFGKRIEEFRSPISGLVLMSFDTPVINKGEELFYISEPKESLK
jgi:predicted deacylase